MDERPDQWSRNGFNALALIGLLLLGVLSVVAFVYGLFASF